MLPEAPQYPFLTRLLCGLYNQGQLPAVATVELEPLYGYVARLTDHNGQVRLFAARNFNLNSANATLISRDKGYTHYFLRASGMQTPNGRVFQLAHHSAEEIATYASELGFPCFVKPHKGIQGQGVVRCLAAADLLATLELYAQTGLTHALIEQAVSLPEYRVVVLDKMVVLAYQRQPWTLVGDGTQTLEQLITQALQHFEQQGRRIKATAHDPRIITTLANQGLSLHSVPAVGSKVSLSALANLSLGSTAIPCLDQLHPRWQTLCVEIARLLDLRCCGIDLFCADITNPQAAYAVLEVNAAPGFSQYAASSPAAARTVRELFQYIFNTVLFEPI